MKTIRVDVNTWSPFPSSTVQKICAHMTAGETSRAMRRSFLYGVWGTATFAAPVGLLILTNHLAVRVAAIELLLIHVASLPIWFKMQRQFLCSLAWASEQAIVPEHLRLFEL